MISSAILPLKRELRPDDPASTDRIEDSYEIDLDPEIDPAVSRRAEAPAKM